MNDWFSKLLLTLSLAMLMVPFTQRLIDRHCQDGSAQGDCTDGGCGNLRQLQERLDRDTIRFGQRTELFLDETAR